MSNNPFTLPFGFCVRVPTYIDVVGRVEQIVLRVEINFTSDHPALSTAALSDDVVKVSVPEPQ